MQENLAFSLHLKKMNKKKQGENVIDRQIFNNILVY